MKEYALSTSCGKDYDGFLLCLTFESVLNYLDSIKAEPLISSSKGILLIDQLLQNCNDPRERLALLNEYLEGFKGTVYRQTMFAEFEMKAHQMAQQGQSLDCDSLSEVYENLIKLYFGDELVIDPEVKYEWARIPHFFNPFYVYVYATGYTSAVAIKEGILKQGQSAVDRYLQFLSMGSSDYPLNELKHAGVDLTSSESIDRAFEKLEEILDDAEKTIELL